MASDGIWCRILIQNEQLVQVNMFPYLGSLITEDGDVGECTTEFRTRLNRWQAIGASQHTDFNEHKANESASVACSHVRLWKLDTQKEWWNTSWGLCDEKTEKGSAGFVNSKENKWVDSQQSWSKEGTVRHCQSKQASILWSQHEETRELPGERNNAKNNARCMHMRKTMHGLDRQQQVVDRTLGKSQSEWQRIEINGEITYMVWPNLGSRTAKEENRTDRGWSPYKKSQNSITFSLSLTVRTM